MKNIQENSVEESNNIFRDEIARSIEIALEKASKKELRIAIDPQSYFGREILKQTEQIIGLAKNITQLSSDIRELKAQTAELINRLSCES